MSERLEAELTGSEFSRGETQRTARPPVVPQGRNSPLLRWARLGLWGALHLATLGVAALAVAGYLGRFGWRLELASHFRLQYGVLLGFSALVYLAGRRLRPALAAGLLSAANLCLVVSVGTPPPPPEDRRVVRAVVCNVRASNVQHDRVVEFVRASKADLVLLVEVNFEWAAAIRALDAEYPYGRRSPAHNSWGLSLLSRLPLDSVEVTMLGEEGQTLAVVARLTVDGQPLTVIGTHPFSPISGGHFRYRNRQLADAATLVRRQKGPVMLMGDLNVSPWSPYFQGLLSASGLRDSRQGFGIQASWPVEFAPVRIPIDHCLVSPEIAVHERQIGPDVGSDHFPVIVDVSLRP